MRVGLYCREASARALRDVVFERERQEAKAAEQRGLGRPWHTCADAEMTDPERLVVLAEEFGEVAKEVCEELGGEAPTGNLRAEIVQVLAVGLAWLEAIDAEAAP